MHPSGSLRIAFQPVAELPESDDPLEPLRVYADPASHPFCIYVPAPA